MEQKSGFCLTSPNIRKCSCRESKMEQSVLRLPSEVWTQVFNYLSVSDKLNIRASCKHFKKLVDHSSLWRGCWVYLDFDNHYSRDFWATLRQRKAASVVVGKRDSDGWRELSSNLPAVSTLVVEQCSRKDLDFLMEFKHLKRLALRYDGLIGLELDNVSVFDPTQLTHLSLCCSAFHSPSIDSYISFLSQFKRLTSLVCHKSKFVGFYHILDCLPHLKHLSLSLYTKPHYDSVRTAEHELGPPEAAHNSELSSLEINGFHVSVFNPDALITMPNLTSLSVFFCISLQRGGWGPLPSADHLRKWLGNLHKLSTLMIFNGPPVKDFVASIPASVTRLTLRVEKIFSEDLAAISKVAPNLLHLHVDSCLGADTAQIPKLFPRLKSLKLNYEHVPEKDFLSLHLLQDLEYLEILDDWNNSPTLSELCDKLRALTDYKLQVKTAQEKDLFSCNCLCKW